MSTQTTTKMMNAEGSYDFTATTDSEDGEVYTTWTVKVWYGKVIATGEGEYNAEQAERAAWDAIDAMENEDAGISRSELLAITAAWGE